MWNHKSATLAFGPKHFASLRCSLRRIGSARKPHCPSSELALEWVLIPVSDALSGFVMVYKKTRWTTQDGDREDWHQTSKMKRCLGCAMVQTTPNITSAKWLEPRVHAWLKSAQAFACWTRRNWETCACDELLCLHLPSRARHLLMSVRETI